MSKNDWVKTGMKKAWLVTEAEQKYLGFHMNVISIWDAAVGTGRAGLSLLLGLYNPLQSSVYSLFGESREGNTDTCDEEESCQRNILCLT